MSTRTASVTVKPPTPTEAEAREAMAKHIECHLAIERIENRAKKITEKVKKKADDKARPHKEANDKAVELLQRYAEGNSQLFKERRKVELYGGHKIGFHTNPPATTLIRPTGGKKKQTWPGLLEALRSAGAWAVSFIRKVEEPNKEELLSAWSKAEEAALDVEKPEAKQAFEQLRSNYLSVGVEVTQTEAFVIELNLKPQTK